MLTTLSDVFMKYHDKTEAGLASLARSQVIPAHVCDSNHDKPAEAIDVAVPDAEEAPIALSSRTIAFQSNVDGLGGIHVWEPRMLSCSLIDLNVNRM